MSRISSAPPQEVEDAELVRRCLSGDEHAWSSLVDRYQRLVFSVALRCGLSREDADDVFQVVFTTLFRRLHALRDETRLASWLITTTQRESWRVARSGQGRIELDDAVVDPSDGAAEIAESSDRDQRVREAITQLDERCRSLLTALFLDAQSPSYGDIAARLDMPLGSIGPTRARCFKKLEALLIEVGLG
jgi:RNA polymerase sigma factor (sigma-70 family)